MEVGIYLSFALLVYNNWMLHIQANLSGSDSIQISRIG
jgi:hypothetical protein